ncbi:hypothetical protein CPC08DRAFT_823121 [Agrocybe pediades]|nr:hypothetical protein CPC08DRAFT_823121 [Agrocybe pediades]
MACLGLEPRTTSLARQRSNELSYRTVEKRLNYVNMTRIYTYLGLASHTQRPVGTGDPDPRVAILHEFEWKDNDWLPEFEGFWTPGPNQPATIEDVWNENRVGMGGRLSVQELTTTWDARWKRNIGKLKTEASRRTKIVNLIEHLTKKPNWNLKLALRFLYEKYPKETKSSRAFADFLQKKGVFSDILTAASSYPGH